MLNKFLIPAALVATVVIAGIFAFMPVEKAATVHGSIDSNVDAEVDAQDRYASWVVNMTDNNKNLVTLIPASSGTITGFATISTIPNNEVGAAAAGVLNCGLSTTAGEQLGINATKGNSTSLAISSVLSADEGIVVEQSVSTQTIDGVCHVAIILDSTTG